MSEENWKLVVTEKRVLTFRFQQELDPGESLSGSPTITVTRLSGAAHADPSQILNGSATVSSPDVLVPVSVTVADIVYEVKVVIDTTTSTKRLGSVRVLEVE